MVKLVVGLGNPGRKYEGTRHNIGFELVAKLAERMAYGEKARNKFDGEFVEAVHSGEKVILACPLTYMNLSGKFVRAICDFYKIESTDMLVACDDLNLPVGKIRLRAKGSAGGQNGLKDIIAKFGHDQFPRLRIGIGQAPAGWDAADYVLGKFRSDEEADVKQAVAQSVAAVDTWLEHGIQRAMNEHNASPRLNEPKSGKEDKSRNAGPGRNGGPEQKTGPEQNLDPEQTDRTTS